MKFKNFIICLFILPFNFTLADGLPKGTLQDIHDWRNLSVEGKKQSDLLKNKDWRGVDLRGEFSYADFSGSVFDKAKSMAGKDIGWGSLGWIASLKGAKFDGVDFTGLYFDKDVTLDGVDLSGATNLPAKWAKGKFLSGAKMPVDLANSGIEEAFGLDGVDFSVSTNLPTNWAKGKDLWGAKMPADLANSGIEEALGLSGVDFSVSMNLAANWAKRKDLHYVKMPEDLENSGIEEATNLINVDFSVSTNLASNWAKGKDLTGAKMPADLANSGIEEATSLIKVDFSESANLAVNWAKGKDLFDAKMPMDLANSGIEGAIGLESVDFSASTNLAANWAKGKDLEDAKMPMDLANSGIEEAFNLEKVDFSNVNKIDFQSMLNRNILSNASFKELSKLEVDGREVEGDELVRFRKNIKILAKNKNAIAGIDDLLKHHMDGLLKEDFDLEIFKNELLAKVNTVEFFQNNAPGLCKRIDLSNPIHDDWFNSVDGYGVKVNKDNFYFELFKRCLDADKNKGEGFNAFKMRNKIRQREADEFDFQEIVVNRKGPEEALQSYIAHLATDKENTLPVKIRFEGEDGADAGGPRKEFFCLMENLVKEKIRNNNTEDQGVMKKLGTMIARTLKVEKDIPAFAIDAPIEFYKLLMDEDLVSYMVAAAYSDEDSAIDNLNSGLRSLAYSFDEYAKIFGLDPRKDTCETFQAIRNDGGIPCFFPGDHSDLEGLAKGFKKVVSKNEIFAIGIQNAEDLKRLVEGEKEIKEDLFLKSISFEDGVTEKELTAYMNAMKSILDDLNDMESKQEFMRDFLSFVTGSRHFDGSTLRFDVNLTPNAYPSAHTCFNTLDCPKIDDEEAIKKRIIEAMQINKKQDGAFGNI